MTLSALVSKDAERKKYKKLYWLRLRASYSNDEKLLTSTPTRPNMFEYTVSGIPEVKATRREVPIP
jgi:hypothetical protein